MSSEQMLRVVTINTGKCDGPYHQRLALLAEGLCALEPDVVALQESFVALDGSADTAGQLGDALGMYVFFSPARRKRRLLEGREVLGDSGMALLTRSPLELPTTIDLPADPMDGDRVSQIGILEVGEERVALANVHLCHLLKSGVLRRHQLETVMEHPILRDDLGARLLLGDFNAIDSSPELVALHDGSLGWSVQDTYAVGDGSRRRETVTESNHFGGCRRANRCIDFILSLSHSGANHPRSRNAKVVLNEPTEGVYPSDHFGVMTDVVLDA